MHASAQAWGHVCMRGGKKSTLGGPIFIDFILEYHGGVVMVHSYR